MKHEQPTSGLASVEVSARGKFCGNLKVCRPSEHLRSPARTPSRHNVICHPWTAQQKPDKLTES